MALTSGSRSRRRAAVPVQPDSIRRAYAGDLLDITRWCDSYLKKNLTPYLPQLLEEHGARTDARDSVPARIAAILSEAKYAFLQRFPTWKLERLLRKYAARTSQHQKTQLQRQLEAQLGVPVAAVLDKGVAKAADEFTAANVSLITTIPEQFFGQVEQTVQQGIRDGKRAEELERDIQDRFGVAKSRAVLIARDQIGKFNGDLNKVRQKSAGITRFVWHTVEDERVRESHAELDGGTFEWDNPPDGDDGPTVPGQDINCRCSAEGVVEDLLA